MPLHTAARFHAFVHRLFRSTDEAETQALYREVAELYAKHLGADQLARIHLIEAITEAVGADCGVDHSHHRYPIFERLVTRLFDYEAFYLLPDINWAETRSVAEWWELREELNRQKHYLTGFEKNCELITLAIQSLVQPLFAAVPGLVDAPQPDDELSLPITLLDAISAPHEVIDTVVQVGFAEELQKQELFRRLSAQFERNVIAASGGNPADPKGFTRMPVWPAKSPLKDTAQLAEGYLGATPVLDFLDQNLDFSITTRECFEHCHMVAGSGHGKTQALQHWIIQHLPAVAQGERSVIVLDSQGDLIHNLAHLKEFAPDSTLHERLVLIDPSDVEWPVSLNLFDVGIERLEGYEPLERERLTNSILELYDFVLGSLLSAEMTQKQNVIFRYVTRLMLHIPDATIHTLRELMEPGAREKFAPHIEKLTGTARQFFETEFDDREFTQTKKQVLRRLWGILENQTFERMFSHPRSKLDLYKEMNEGKIILINTAKDLLKEQGSEIFGRFFIALVAQAAQERATIPADERLPTLMFIDEAADYFDRNIGVILAQARKYNVGIVAAHQYLTQLDPKLQDAFAANTAIKFAGGVSAKDARSLATMLRCAPEAIEQQPKGSFACSVRGQTNGAVSLRFPFGTLEGKARVSDEEWEAIRDRVRERYAVHHTEFAGHREEMAADKEHTTEQAQPTKAAKPIDPNPDQVNIEPGSTW